MRNRILAGAFAMMVLASCGSKWNVNEGDGYLYITQKGGPTLGYTSAHILEDDGYAFKDLNRNGILDPYEDWRLEPLTRAKDLAGRLSIEEIAGLMLYSSHQAIPGDGSPFASYTGKTNHKAWDITDQQLKFLKEDNLRTGVFTGIKARDLFVIEDSEPVRYD